MVSENEGVGEVGLGGKGLGYRYLASSRCFLCVDLTVEIYNGKSDNDAIRYISG